MPYSNHRNTRQSISPWFSLLLPSFFQTYYCLFYYCLLQQIHATVAELKNQLVLFCFSSVSHHYRSICAQLYLIFHLNFRSTCHSYHTTWSDIVQPVTLIFHLNMSFNLSLLWFHLNMSFSPTLIPHEHGVQKYVTLTFHLNMAFNNINNNLHLNHNISIKETRYCALTLR